MKQKNIFLFLIMTFLFEAQVFSQPSSAEGSAYPDGEWIQRFAPYGIDLVPTADSVVAWVNMAKVGKEIDFSILASDLMRRNNRFLTTYIRSDHERDNRVPYRTGIARVSFDCSSASVQILSWATYDAKGEALSSSDEARAAFTAMPGSQSYRWLEFACGVGAGRPRY